MKAPRWSSHAMVCFDALIFKLPCAVSSHCSRLSLFKTLVRHASWQKVMLQDRVSVCRVFFVRICPEHPRNKHQLLYQLACIFGTIGQQPKQKTMYIYFNILYIYIYTHAFLLGAPCTLHLLLLISTPKVLLSLWCGCLVTWAYAPRRSHHRGEPKCWNYQTKSGTKNMKKTWWVYHPENYQLHQLPLIWEKWSWKNPELPIQFNRNNCCHVGVS